MNTDLAIAQAATLRHITHIAAELGLNESDLELYGAFKAKIAYPALNRLLSGENLHHEDTKTRREHEEGQGEREKGKAGTEEPAQSKIQNLKSKIKNGKIVLVTAITPTPAGEGKTTVTIGLAQALCKLGKQAISATREPSMGPVFGVKGGAAGGGHAQVLPMEDINLHFTGDMHAIGAAHNLLAAMLDNHLQQGNALDIEPRTIAFGRVVDMNDRALRNLVLGLGGRTNGVPREAHFSITVASEVMAILCLSNSLTELKERLGKILVGRTKSGKPVTAADLKANGAMTAILRDALKPNLVQTLEGTPALVHGGPFGNIAHGCNSVMATRLARRLGEIVVTEAGFGSDLGFEKYCDIVAPSAGLPPDAVVLVATIRALKMHGGVSKKKLEGENVEAVKRGLTNLDRHAANVAQMGVPFVIAINHFHADTEAETQTVVQHCQEKGWRVAVANVWGEGGEGGRALGEAVLQALETPGNFAPNYTPEMSLLDKLNAIARRVYGANGVTLSAEADAQREWLEQHGFGDLRICIAKTQYSFSDDPKAGAAPTGFTIHVRSLSPSAGAGFVVALAGDIMTMPGLPEHPAAENIDVDEHGQITGLF